MASTRQKTTASGQPFYEIRVSRGRGKSYLTKRWYPPDGWSKRAIDRELTKVAAEFERQAAAGEVISREEQKEKDLQAKREAAKILSLKQYGETVFMPSKAVTMSENGRYTYQLNLDHWIYPALGDLKMPDITPANITALLLDMQSQGKAHATAVKTYTVLSSLFKMAYLGDAVPVNPMDKVERPKPRKDEGTGKSVEAYTPEQIQQIIFAVQAEPLKWQCYFRLLIDTGIRRGECSALRWENVNFKENTITIAGNLCYTPDKGTYLDTPKSGKTRLVDVDPAVMSLLRQLRQEQASTCISPWVFTQENSPEPMHPQTPVRYMKKFSKRYGIPGLHPHLLRHSFASIAITYGADIASVSHKLGHAEISTTLNMYTHPDMDSQKKASSIFREALKKAGQG